MCCVYVTFLFASKEHPGDPKDQVRGASSCTFTGNCLQKSICYTSKLTVAKNKHFICSLWMCRNKGCAFLIHAGSLLLFFFFFNRPFPTQNKVWTLQIQSLKLKRTFFWQGHQEHKASRKHIEGSTPVELIMTKLPLRLWAAFYSLLCTWLWFPWI